MRRFVAFLAVTGAMGASPAARAVSFYGDGSPIVYKDGSRLCLRVEEYVSSHSVLSFLTRYRDVDARDIQLLNISVYSDTTRWRIEHENAPTSGARLRKATRICYGDAPAGFVTTDHAQALAAGQYDVQMEAREGQRDLLFLERFCLSNDGHLVDCDLGEKPRPSFLKKLFGWLFGD